MDDSRFKDDFKRLVELIDSSRFMTAFTGAGVSTLSGIPDFRGLHGVYTDPWHGMEVEEILSLDFFARHPEVFYAWAKDVWYHLEEYEPNVVHRTLAALEGKGILKALYTQNIDMLHQRAGSRNVYEVHGGPEHHHCTKCHAEYTYDFVAPIVRAGEVPRCKKCGGVIKPDIVFYGENLDENVLQSAWRDFSNTDLCLVLGSSLVVQPAASFPVIALRSGAKVVIVNAQPTSQDYYATLHFDDLEQTFDALASVYC